MIISWLNRRFEILALRNRFKGFVRDIPAVTAQLESELQDMRLNHTMQSVKQLNELIPNIKNEMKGRSEEWWISRIGAYAGETIRRLSGTQWLLDEDRLSENYGQSFLRAKTGYSIYPMQIAFNAWDESSSQPQYLWKWLEIFLQK